MEGNIIIRCHGSPSYHNSIVQGKYLKEKNSDLGILTVLEILGEKKSVVFLWFDFFFVLFCFYAFSGLGKVGRQKRLCILFELQGWTVCVVVGTKEKVTFPLEVHCVWIAEIFLKSNRSSQFVAAFFASSSDEGPHPVPYIYQSGMGQEQTGPQFALESMPGLFYWVDG